MGDPEQLVTVTATHGVLPTLGVPAHIDRWFSEEDDTPGFPQTVIISYATIEVANQDLARVWSNWGGTDGMAGKMIESLSVKPNLRRQKGCRGRRGLGPGRSDGSLALVLFLVCANVTNLVLVRAQ
jgi:hypothetical protein